MIWHAFGGDAHEIDLALLKERCICDGVCVSDEVIARHFRSHLHRGISYLATPQMIRSISELVKLATVAGDSNRNPSKGGVG
jgi:DNA sulfur modification protein DndE